MQRPRKEPRNTPTSEVGTTDELLVHVPARWGDMDAYGHVNNVAILSVMEEARVALFGPPPSSGQKPTVAPQPPIPLFDLVAEGVQALIAEHGIRYLAQLPYTGEPVPVRLSVEKVSAASVRMLSISPGGRPRMRACLYRAGVLGFGCGAFDPSEPRAA